MSHSHHGLALDTAAWDSPWRHRAVRDKATLAFGLLTCALALPWWPGGMATGVVAAAILLGPAAVPPGVLLRGLAAPVAFIMLGALSLLVSVSWADGLVVGWAPTVSPAVAVAVRGVTATLAVFVMAATTPMVDLVAALRRARVPQACLDVTSVAYRLLFVLLESLHAVRDAQTARLGYDGRRATLRSSAALTGAVLVRAWDRAARLESGLAGRGGAESLGTLDPPTVASTRFLIVSLTGLALLAGFVLLVGGW